MNRQLTSRGKRQLTSRAASIEPAAARPKAAVSIRSAVISWLAEGRSQHWSPRTLTAHRENVERFCWWLENEAETRADLDALAAANIRAFLAYLAEPHPTGRFDNTTNAQARKACKPSSMFAYYRDLKAFARFLLRDEILTADPFRNVKPPKIPNDQIVPFTADQVRALLDEARRGRNPERDVAMLLVLTDTGLRVSELCALTRGDVDRVTGDITVRHGKGGKFRKVSMGSAARRALWRYVEQKRCDAGEAAPVFISEGGHTQGAALTRAGVAVIIANLGRRAGISGVRCSPHTCRHFYAVSFLRGGGNVLELQQLLGHETLEMTRRYVVLAGMDLADAARRASPADRLKLK